MYTVYLVEFERGWDSKVFDVLKFQSKDEADAKIHEVNSKNNEPVTPDYYIKASYSPDGW